MPARRRQRLGFAVFFVVAVVGAVLLIVSQIPLRREHYDVVETKSFSWGQPLTFYYTFEPGVKYRFEVKGVNWTSQPSYFRYLNVGNDTYLSGGGLLDPPWVWDENPELMVKCVLSVTFWHYGYGQEIEQATTPTFVEISALKQTTYHLTYLIYVGLPLLIVSAILITLIGKDADSRMRMRDTI